MDKMEGNHRKHCSINHMEGASQLHEDGKFCDEWLGNLERALFTRSQCNVLRRIVMRDLLVNTQRFDWGQWLRFEVSLSKALPEKKWGLLELAASLGPFKGMAKTEQEFRNK